MRWWDWVTALAAVTAVAAGLVGLEHGRSGLDIQQRDLGETPATIVRPADLSADAPVPGTVVIAHGFAGSRRLMEPFAFTLARAGYHVVSFDFIGHGEHPRQLPERIEGEEGAASALIAQLRDVVEAARAMVGDPDAPYALLGHSMATDLLSRATAAGSPGQLVPEATIAVSLFSPEVTPTTPPNMLIITGSWEDGLTDEALRVVRLAQADLDEGATDGGPAASLEETVGRFEDGTARRAMFPEGVEHIGVLYDPEGLQAARAWLDRVFDRPGADVEGAVSGDPAPVDARGPLLALVFFGMIAAARPLSFALPRCAAGGTGAAAGWKLFAALAILPALLTPLIVTQLPSGLLPIILGDYLAKHFLVYGLLTWAGLWLAARRGLVALPSIAGLSTVWSPMVLGALGVAAWTLVAFALTLERYAFSFLPTSGRAVLIPVFFLAFLPWFLADEWLTRGPGTRLLPYVLTKFCFVISLGLAVAIDPPRLFFLLIVAPVILVFFAVYGVLSHWSMQRSQQPLVAGGGIALALGWSVAVSFPLLGG